MTDTNIEQEHDPTAETEPTTVCAEIIWDYLEDVAERHDIEATVEAVAEECAIDPETRIVENDDGFWVKTYLSYHDPESYDPPDPGGHDRLRRDEAERLGADPCPSCYPDHPDTEWADVTQFEGPGGDTVTKMVPKGADDDGDGDDESEADPTPDFTPDPDPVEYHETARALFTEYTPDDPEAGTMRSEEAFHAYLREQGARVLTDPSGTVMLTDVPGSISPIDAALARGLEESLYSIFGFEEPPTIDPEEMAEVEEGREADR